MASPDAVTDSNGAVVTEAGSKLSSNGDSHRPPLTEKVQVTEADDDSTIVPENVEGILETGKGAPSDVAASNEAAIPVKGTGTTPDPQFDDGSAAVAEEDVAPMESNLRTDTEGQARETSMIPPSSEEDDRALLYAYPILVRIDEEDEYLLLPHKSDTREALLDGLEKDCSTEQLFQMLRDALSQRQSSFSMDEELVLRFDQLGLALGEDNVYCKDITLADIMKLLVQLTRNTKSRKTSNIVLEIGVDFQDRFISTFNYLSQLCRDGKGFDIGGDDESDEEGMIALEDSGHVQDGEAKERLDAQDDVNDDIAITDNALAETGSQATAEAAEEVVAQAGDEAVTETGDRTTAKVGGDAIVEAGAEDVANAGNDIAPENEDETTAGAGEEADVVLEGVANVDVVADEHQNATRMRTNEGYDDEMDTHVSSKISDASSANAELSMSENMDGAHSAQPVSHEQIEVVKSFEPDATEDTTTTAAVTTASEVRANGADNVTPAPAEIQPEVEPDFFTTEDEGAGTPTPRPAVLEISRGSDGDDDIELLEYEDIPDDEESSTEKVADSSSKHDIDDGADDGPETKRSKHGD